MNCLPTVTWSGWGLPSVAPFKIGGTGDGDRASLKSKAAGYATAYPMCWHIWTAAPAAAGPSPNPWGRQVAKWMGARVYDASPYYDRSRARLGGVRAPIETLAPAKCWTGIHSIRWHRAISTRRA